MKCRQELSGTGFSIFPDEMSWRRFVLLFVGSVILSGCTVIERMDQLLTLKRVADSQKKIHRYLKRQERYFDRIVRDVRRGALETGVSREEITGRYGEPVLRDDSDDPAVSEILLYRHPTEYFASARVYLSFDQSGTLAEIEYREAPASAQKERIQE
ncbi:MAG: hypothetical protein GF333_02470 [Candidatus Omnitrophica bacterium]|nr:hypothetical protein [Candidatus Omnitrophota bacterium]